MARRDGLSWRTKLFVLLMSFAIVPLVAGAYWNARTHARVTRKNTLAALEALASAKAQALDQFTESRRRDVERIAHLLSPSLVRVQEARVEVGAPPKPPPEMLPDLADAEEIGSGPGDITDPLPDPEQEAEPETGGEAPDGGKEEKGATTPEAPSKPQPEPAHPSPTSRKPADAKKSVKAGAGDDEQGSVLDEARTRVRRVLGLVLWDQAEFEELLIIDAAGRVTSSTFEGHEGYSAETLEYFKAGRKGTYLQPLFKSPITGQLTMVFATPIRNDKHETIGVLAARLNMSRFFRLLAESPGLGETGETVVAKKDQDNVLFMAPTRHDPSAALNRAVPFGGVAAKALQESVLGRSGAGEALDYRGERVLAAWRPVPSLQWGLVTKLDLSEAMDDVAEVREASAWLTVVIVLLAVMASALVTRAFMGPLGQLKEATERISRGDFQVNIDIRSRDEIGELADSFERMVAAIKFFREHTRPDEEDYEIAPELPHSLQTPPEPD